MLTEAEQDASQLLEARVAEFETVLSRKLSCLPEVPEGLAQAMQYALSSGGKRLRPVLVILSCEACGGMASAAYPAALAIEFIHTFSLIHDDLPALDNDVMRRGRPTCHVKFGESTAILAGDALLAWAFEILADDVADPMKSQAMAGELARATGAAGMIGGEFMDLLAERAAPDTDLTARIHEAKTARLFEAACRLGALAADADEATLRSLGRFGRLLGMAFQVADDLLDVTGSLESTGKATGKDAPGGKQTFPRAVGVKASVERLESLSAEAIDALSPLGDRAAALAALTRHLVRRTR